MDRSLQDTLVRLADESLTPAERERALEAIAGVEGAEASLAGQQEVRRRVRGVAGVPAPLELRERVEALQADAVRDQQRRRHRRRPRLLIGLAAVAGVTALIVIGVLTQVRSDERTLRYATISLLASTSPPPPPAKNPALLDASFAGITYPRWGPKFGWFESGARTGKLYGRPAETVFYTHQGHRIAYTVVQGPPLPMPDGGRRVVTPAGTVHVFTPGEAEIAVPSSLLTHGGRPRVAVFERRGHTCVLAGIAHHESTLIKLASWKGSGSIPF